MPMGTRLPNQRRCCYWAPAWRVWRRIAVGGRSVGRSGGASVTRRTHEIVVACVLAGAVFWMYGGIVSSLARQWASDDNYSHGFFVVPLALYFAWERRGHLKAASVHPSSLGVLLIASSLGVLLCRLLGAELF